MSVSANPSYPSRKSFLFALGIFLFYTVAITLRFII
jgi:hypothetical protein